jgi:hypothetical protein
MNETKYPNSGALFKNNRKREGQKDPDYSGSLNCDGKDYWLSAWIKDGHQGKGKFMSISLKPKEKAQATPAAQPENDEDDDVPF